MAGKASLILSSTATMTSWQDSNQVHECHQREVADEGGGDFLPTLRPSRYQMRLLVRPCRGRDGDARAIWFTIRCMHTAINALNGRPLIDGKPV